MSGTGPDRTAQTGGGVDWAALHARVRAAMAGLAAGFEPDAAEVERRLRDRAARLARPADRADAAHDLHLLTFTLGGQALAVDSALVREVCADLVPTPVPHVPAWVAGVVHLRGEMLTIADFHALAGGAGAGDTGGDRVGDQVLVLHRDDRALGLAVDGIGGLMPVTRAGLGAVPATVHGGRRYYLGVADDGTLVLDGTAFFDEGGLPGLQGRGAGAED